VLAGGHRAALSDPDRDTVFIVNLDTLRVETSMTLEKGDEPHPRTCDELAC